MKDKRLDGFLKRLSIKPEVKLPIMPSRSSFPVLAIKRKYKVEQA